MKCKDCKFYDCDGFCRQYALPVHSQCETICSWYTPYWVHQSGDLYECPHCGAIEHVCPEWQFCPVCGNRVGVKK